MRRLEDLINFFGELDRRALKFVKRSDKVGSTFCMYDFSLVLLCVSNFIRNNP